MIIITNQNGNLSYYIIQIISCFQSAQMTESLLQMVTSKPPEIGFIWQGEARVIINEMSNDEGIVINQDDGPVNGALPCLPFRQIGD